jgi:hypothetical protein
MRVRAALVGLIAIAAPARADHAGPSAGAGSASVVSPDTLEKGRLALGLRLTYARPEQRSDVELARLAGQHVHAHNTDFNLIASAAASYGLTDRLALSAELPYVRRDGLREGTHSHVGGQAVNGVERLGSVSGLGDATLLARYRLSGGGSTAFALIGGVKIPTGSTHRRSRAGERLETEHQPGTGSWDPVAGAAFATRLGPVRLTAGGLYQFSGLGAQRTRLGNRGQAGIALSHGFGPPEHHHEEPDGDHDEGDSRHAEPHGHASWDAFVELAGEWEGRQRIAGQAEADSGGRSLWLTPGARFNAAGGFSAGLSVGLPLWQRIRASHPDNGYRVTFSLGRAF